MLYIIYTSKKVSSIFLNHTINHIINKYNDNIISISNIIIMIGEVEDIIRFLSNIIPNWLEIVDNPEGNILRMNKQKPISEVRNDLIEYFYK